MKVLVFVLALVALTYGTLAPFKQSVEKEDRVPGRYIIKLKDGVSVDGFINTAEFTNLNTRIRHTYRTVLNGLAVDLPAQYLDRLRSLPSVDVIYEGGVMHAMQNVPEGAWGIDRVDQRTYPLDDMFNPRSAGDGVKIYICDTGIRSTHNDFGGRVTSFFNFENGPAEDCNGHGTHCSGIAAGKTYGVARGAALYAARVLNCFGNGIWDDLIKALDLIGLETGNRVVSLSLGGGRYDIVDDAVERVIATGAVVVVAAGNAYNDACHYTPARSPSAITIGSVVYTYDPITHVKNGDTRASSSNYGTCLDIFAPGNWIESTWHTSDDATANLSGTSMAAPHVSGACALYLKDGVIPSQVVNSLIRDATVNAIDDPGPDSPNLLLYVD